MPSVPSVRLNSPKRSPKSVRTSNLRPQSASATATHLKKDSSRLKLDTFTSPRINSKLSVVTNSNLVDSEASTPHNRVQSAILGKSQTVPSFLNKMYKRIL